MAAAEYYDDAQLHGINGSQKQELLFRKGVNWNDYPTHFKRGTYVQRRPVVRTFSAQDLEALPPQHAARSNPALLVQRHEVTVLELPPITQIRNREALIFEAAEPELAVSAPDPDAIHSHANPSL